MLNCIHSYSIRRFEFWAKHASCGYYQNVVTGNIHEVDALGVVLVDVQKC